MRRLVIAAFVLLPACGGAAAEVPVAAPAAPQAGPDFAAWEAHWLDELGATDPRLAMRLPMQPSVEARERAAAEAIVRGEEGVGVKDGAIDLFSFDERARRLATLRRDLAQAPSGHADEAALLRRILDGEDLRLAAERQTPESASERVRAIVATWGHPGSARDVAAREHEVAHGLTELIAGVRIGRLSGPRVLELEDELDPLERLAVPEGYPESTRVITELRIELEKARPTGANPEALTPLPMQLATYLGVKDDKDALTAHLEGEELTLRGDVKAALARLSGPAAEAALATAATHVQAEASCSPSAPVSPARMMRPPEERSLACDVLRVAAGAETDDAAAVVALHDAVAIGLWALALEKGATDLDVTRTNHPLLAAVPHERQERLVRSALVSPVRAIAPAVAVLILDADGQEARRSRAARWIAFGDAPFDVVSAALSAPKPRE